MKLRPQIPLSNSMDSIGISCVQIPSSEGVSLWVSHTQLSYLASDEAIIPSVAAMVVDEEADRCS